MRLSRPVPIQDPSEATLGALRQAILQAHALESKFFIYGEDTTILHERWRKLDPLLAAELTTNLAYDDAWLMLLRDRRHMFQSYAGAICIRDVFSGHVVASLPFKNDIYFLRHGVYKGQAVLGVLSMVESKLVYVIF